MRCWLIGFMMFTTVFLKGQEHFVKSIDMMNLPQFAREILINDGEYLLTVQSRCRDSIHSCGGVIKVNIDGEILDTFLNEDFSNNLQSFYKKDSTFYYSGEYKMGIANEISVLELNSNLDIIDVFHASEEDTIYYNYFATGSLLFNERHIVVGSSFCQDECPQVGILFSFSHNILDTSIIYSFVDRGFTVASTILSSEKELVLYFQYTSSINYTDSIRIIKLDTLFNKTFQWSLPIKDRGHIPRGCVTSDDNMIITVPGGFLGNTEEIWSLDTNGTTNWIYEWPSDLGTTNVLRIEEAKNGDLFVMGQRWNPAVLDDKRNVAIVMRLDKDGHELWRRYFKLADQNTLLSNSVSDLVELDNGDLLLTGQTRRIIYDPSIGMERPDQDIFWARIGGDGCINGDCEEEYIVTSTEEVEIEKDEWARIYPNPVSDKIVAQCDIDCSITIYNKLGQEVMAFAPSKEEVRTLDISTLDPGMYIIAIHDEKAVRHVTKFIKI